MMQEVETWTPKLVGERLIEAVRWARYAAGPVGPSGVRGSMPEYAPTWEDRLAEGWGLPDGPDADEEANAQRQLRIMATPAQIDAHLAALEWPARYVVPDAPGDARVLNLWVRCKVFKRPFNEAVDKRRFLTRAAAYRMRDRALTTISVKLDRDGVPL